MKYKKNYTASTEETVVASRVRFPKGKEMFGMIESRLGYGRMNIICGDGKVRIGAVPGKYKRRLWLREGDIVIIEPWEYEGDRKGNVTYKYRKSHVEFLRNNNHLKCLETE